MKIPIFSALMACMAAVCAFPQQGVDYITQVKNKPVVDPRQYNFSFASGAGVSGNLSVAGSNTLTFAIAPLGVAGTDVSHALLISGGTGTVEEPLITGGTCTPLAANCTLTVTTANTHTGSWSVGSATAGAQESWEACPGCTVKFPDGGPFTFQGPLTCLSASSARGGGVLALGNTTIFAAQPIALNAGCTIQGVPSYMNYNGSTFPDSVIIAPNGSSTAEVVHIIGGGSGNAGVALADFTIEANGQGMCVMADGSGTRLYIRDFGCLSALGDGIHLTNGGGGQPHITDALIDGATGDCIYNTWNDMYAENVELENCGAAGLEDYGASATHFVNGDISSNGTYGFWFHSSTGFPFDGFERISNSQFANNIAGDIFIDGLDPGGSGTVLASQNSIIGNNFFFQTGTRPNNTYPSIRLSDTYGDTVIGNTWHVSSSGVLYSNAIDVDCTTQCAVAGQGGAIQGNSIPVGVAASAPIVVPSILTTAYSNNIEGGTLVQYPALAYASRPTAAAAGQFFLCSDCNSTCTAGSGVAHIAIASGSGTTYHCP